MNSKNMDSGSIDIISSLPDALVCHILSFLSTKDAALTSVLSHRWRNLLAFVPNLDLDNSIYGHPDMGRLDLRKSFKLFVNRVMALQGNAPLNEVSLRCQIGGYDQSIVNGWILNVLERGVVDFDLYIASECDFPLPPNVLMSKTLVRLKLAGTCRFAIDVGEVFLPKLKTLHIDDVWFKDGSGASFAKLISGCHVLEELTMTNVRSYLCESFSVSNQNLKRLTISCDHHETSPKSLSFDTPNLIYLAYSNDVPVKHPKRKIDIFAEVLRRFGTTPHPTINVEDSLMGISNIKILYLTSHILKVLTCRCKAIPVFNNLIHLTIKTDEKVGWKSLPNLLEKCPNLETLVFEGLHYKDTNQCEDERFSFGSRYKCLANRCVCKPWEGTPVCLSSSPVKILKILEFGEISGYQDDLIKQKAVIKYFVENMPNLEQVVLYCDAPIDGDLSILLTQPHRLEKAASPKCKIQVVPDSSTLEIPSRFEDHPASSQRS